MNHTSQRTERSQEPLRAQRLYEHGRQIRREAQVLTTTVEHAAEDISAFLRQQTTESPYRTLAAAAGVGFIIGGGLASRMTKVLLGVGGRVVMAMVVRELTAALEPSARQPK